MSSSTLPAKGIARRSIVRGGVTASWAVPPITVVAAAPAFAACTAKTGATSNLSTSIATCTREQEVVALTANLNNAGGPVTTPAITVENVTTNGSNTLQTLTATDWVTAGSATGNGSPTLASAKSASHTSGGPSYAFTVMPHNHNPAQDLDVSVTTGNGGALSAQGGVR